MRLVVGLGNPGGEYERTRHNLGWLAVDELASRLGATRFRKEGPVECAEAFVGDEKAYLLKPQTYMNRSGQALASWLGRFKEVLDEVREAVPAASAEPVKMTKQEAEEARACVWPRLLVVADDVNLLLGRMRFRPSGSAGGHNGLKDIQKALGGMGYPRLRLGVGSPPERMDRVDYVLSRFSAEEGPLVRKVAETAAAAIWDWMTAGMDKVREKYNGLTLGGAADA